MDLGPETERHFGKGPTCQKSRFENSSWPSGKSPTTVLLYDSWQSLGDFPEGQLEFSNLDF
jgi:hypothetical protein